MFSAYKELIVVACLAAVVFGSARPVFTRFMSQEDFGRRRNVWLLLTLAAFLVQSFWLYLPVAVAVLAYGAYRDRNRAALYALLLFAVPPNQIEISGFGLVQRLFPLDHFRLLSLVILAPVALHLIRSADKRNATTGVRIFDILILCYFTLQFTVTIPYDSTTHTVRRIFLAVLDILIPYYVFRSACRTPAMIREVMACFALGILVLAPVAVFEYLKGWLLYPVIGDQWGAPTRFAYLLRGDHLRVQATAGHAIVLGYAMAMALACWLYLRSHTASRFWSVLGMAALCVGMIATFSRGPWLGAATALFAFLLAQPRSGARLFKTILVVMGFGGVVVVSPVGDAIIDYLPFLGTTGMETVGYRQQLMKMSWSLIKQNPLFGTPFFISEMEEMRQGQGIIDVVNSYAFIALSYGLVGLGLFAAFFLGITWKAYKAAGRAGAFDKDLSLMGASLLACMICTLIVLGTASFWLGVPYIAWMFSGLALNYAQVSEDPEITRIDGENMSTQAAPRSRWHPSVVLPR